MAKYIIYSVGAIAALAAISIGLFLHTYSMVQ